MLGTAHAKARGYEWLGVLQRLSGGCGRRRRGSVGLTGSGGPEDFKPPAAG